MSASVALAAERIAAPPARTAAVAGDADVADIASFVVPATTDSIPARFHMTVTVDPFDSRWSGGERSAVASAYAVPTVPAASTTPLLTAILIADERRVAVVDDAMVTVGDVLRDGARVSAIQPDRVFVVERNGRWRTLTLTNRGTR